MDRVKSKFFHFHVNTEILKMPTIHLNLIFSKVFIKPYKDHIVQGRDSGSDGGLKSGHTIFEQS